MSLSVRCILCLNKSLEQLQKLSLENKLPKEQLEQQEEKMIENVPYEIQSKLITKTEIESMQALGMEMAQHLQTCHREELEKIAILQVHFNGFNVMKLFETKDEDSIFEKEKEKMRDRLSEEILRFAPDDDFDDDSEDEGEDFLFDDDEDEEKDELLAKNEKV